MGPKKYILILQMTSDPDLAPVNLHILDKLWIPDVEILNLQAFETHIVLSKLEGSDAKYFNLLFADHIK